MTLKLKLKTSDAVKQEIKKLQDSLQNPINEPEKLTNTTAQPSDSSAYTLNFRDMLKRLNKKYPKLFPLKGTRPALKKGIKNDLVPFFQDISKSKIHKFLYWYTFSKAYGDTHFSGAPRYDLDYKVVGHVTEQESSNLRKEIAKINSKKNI